MSRPLQVEHEGQVIQTRHALPESAVRQAVTEVCGYTPPGLSIERTGQVTYFADSYLPGTMDDPPVHLKIGYFSVQ